MRCLLLPLLLLGCSPPPDCEAGGLAFYSERGPVDCAVVERNVELARAAIVRFTGRDLKPSAVVRIRPELVWDHRGPTYGEYLPESGEVLLNRNMQNLAHELFHRADDDGAGEIDATHAGWETNGRWAASVEYNSRVERP